MREPAPRVRRVYDVALTVAACLQAGTRADVAWLVGVDGLPVGDWSDAIAFTPGGGKTGALLAGGLDGKLAEQAGRFSTGRLLELEITEVDALIAELPATGSVQCVLAPADALPPRLWELAAARERFCLVSHLNADVVTDVGVYSRESISEADPEVRDIFDTRPAGSTITDEMVVSVFSAVPQMVIVGAGPIVEALGELARSVGWQSQVATTRDMAVGLIAPLSSYDKVVIAAHDLELAGAGLVAALGSGCGYIGSVGSRKMQADRADWLAYRGITDLGRIRGPAGLDIGAATPGEVAVAIAAEAIAETR